MESKQSNKNTKKSVPRMRSLLRTLALDFLGSFSKPAKGIHILNGHRISLSKPDASIFQQQLSELQNFVRFIRFEDAVDLIVSKTIVDEVLVAFSFDDGFEECYTKIAPVLDNFGINAAFFVNPNFVDGDTDYLQNFTQNIVKTSNKKPMSWEQIIDLHKRGHIIGSHTLDHFNINTNDGDELVHQLFDSKIIIEERIGSPCLYFAFPFGRLNHANLLAIDVAKRYYPYVFSQSDYRNYFSFQGKVINRRHFEPDWKLNHVKYFLSAKKKWS
jgi:peptidoglycan/xylan/chitin deacetylase (PgdA/CDA1 family)